MAAHTQGMAPKLQNAHRKELFLHFFLQPKSCCTSTALAVFFAQGEVARRGAGSRLIDTDTVSLIRHCSKTMAFNLAKSKQNQAIKAIKLVSAMCTLQHKRKPKHSSKKSSNAETLTISNQQLHFRITCTHSVAKATWLTQAENKF